MPIFFSTLILKDGYILQILRVIRLAILPLIKILPACFCFFVGTAQAAATLDSVVLQLKWKHQFEYAGYYAAVAQGYYSDEGLDVQIRDIQSGVSPISAVLDGTANYGIWPSGLVLEKMRGKPVVLLANDLKISPLVLLAGSSYSDPVQLQGKKVMGARDESENAEIAFMLKASGIDVADLDWVDHTFDANDVVNNRVAAMTAYLTNQPYDLVQNDIPHTIFNPHDYGIDFYGNILFTSEKESVENPERTRRFVRASKKGWLYALEHFSEIVDLILAQYSIEKSREALLFEAREIKKIMESMDCQIGSVDPVRLDYIAKMFVALGMADNDYDLSGLIFGGAEAICNESQVLLSSEELFYIKQHPVIRVPNMLDIPPYGFNDNGQPKGVSIDLMNLIAAKAGLTVEYVSGSSWSEAMTLHDGGELDLLLSVAKTPDLEEKYLFSDSYLRGTPFIYVRNNSAKIESLDDLAGRTVAVSKGWHSERLLQLYYPKVRLLQFENILDALQAVADGNADATVVDQAVADFLTSKHGIAPLVAAPVADKRFMISLHLGFRQDNVLLRNILNKAVKAVTTGEKLFIQQKWLQEAQKESPVQPSIDLSSEESVYLANREPVNICVSNELPYEEIDADGIHVGLAADFMAVFLQRLGLDSRLVPNVTWNHGLDMMKAGGCDILSMVVRSPDRENYMSFTDPYLITPMAIVVRQGEPFLNGLSGLKGKTLATVEGHQIGERVPHDYPEIKLIFEKSIEGTLLAVSKGGAYAAVGPIVGMGSNIKNLRLIDLKIAGHAPYGYSFSVGVRKDDPLLLAVFQKAVSSLSPKENDDIVGRWVDLSITQEVDTSMFWKTLAALAVILLSVLYRHIVLARVNARLQKAHKEVQLEKERAERALLAEQEAISQNVRFVDMIGHEYRTPVSIISANLDILEMKAEQKEEPRSPQVVKMRNAVDRLVELIESALDKVRHADASITVKNEVIDLSDVLTGVIDSACENHPDRQISIDLFPPKPCMVVADQTLLKTAFANLIDNALKYSKDEIEVEICPSPNQKFYEIVILDRGIGIPIDEQEHVVEKYSRAANASHIRGTGIGLYLVHKVVLLHNGSLEFFSRQGGGTKVVVRLMAAE